MSNLASTEEKIPDRQYDDHVSTNNRYSTELTKDKKLKELEAENIRLKEELERRKSLEEFLRLSEDKFSKAFYNNQTMMVIANINDSVCIDVNDSFADAHDYKREELIGKNISELIIWGSLKEPQEVLNQVFEKGYIRNFEHRFKRKTGEIGFALSTFNLLDLDGERCLLISAIDITERKKAEEALCLSDELFQKIFNANPLPMAIVSIKNENILEVNEAFLKRGNSKKQELVKLKVTDLGIWVDINECFRLIEEIKKEGLVHNFEARLSLKPGKTETFLFSGNIINWRGEECMLGIANDITELRRYQNEIARLERLNLIGEMAAGIGHEIRNPMTTIKGFLQLLKEKDRYAQDRDIMDLMVEELDRANSIITEFLSLARNKAVELKMQSLNQKIRAILPLIQADAMKQDKNIELELGDIRNIKIDKNEIQQLILNLVRNGLEAMLPGGVLTIKTFQEGDNIVLAVKDQGSGLAPDVLKKIGTPFFTTKDHGTGLGLAVCNSIAARHNASIDIDTCSEGTTFFVRFKS